MFATGEGAVRGPVVGAVHFGCGPGAAAVGWGVVSRRDGVEVVCDLVEAGGDDAEDSWPNVHWLSCLCRARSCPKPSQSRRRLTGPKGSFGSKVLLG